MQSGSNQLHDQHIRVTTLDHAANETDTVSVLADIVKYVQHLGEPFCQILQIEQIPPQNKQNVTSAIELIISVFAEIMAGMPFFYVFVGDEDLAIVLGEIAMQHKYEIPFYDSLPKAHQYASLRLEGLHLQQSVRTRTTRNIQKTAPLLGTATAPQKMPSQQTHTDQPNHFPARGILRLYCADLDQSILLIPTEDLVLGRRHPSGAQPDVDLALWAGYSKGISRQHAKFVLTEDHELQLVDLNSTNGTMLNDKQLEPFQTYPLKSEDEISLGKLTIKVNFQELIKPHPAHSA